MPSIRAAEIGDAPAIRDVLVQAFGRPNEADLVEALTRAGKAVVSLVAVENDEVFGHILFSPVRIESEHRQISALALAPLAVHPIHQKKGIGAQLMQAGLDACRLAGHMRIIVLGHPGYYIRFGFVPASGHGIRCEFEVPDEAFMAAELEPDALAACAGTVRYPPEFMGV